MSFLVQTLNEGAHNTANFVGAILKPDSIDADWRKGFIYAGVIGIVASLAANFFGQMAAASAYTFAAYSASLLVAGATGMIIFTFPPALALGAAFVNSLASADIIWVVSL